MSKFTSIPVSAEKGDQLDVSVQGIRVEETVPMLMSPEQFDSFGELERSESLGKIELQPCTELIRLTPEEPQKRVKVPYTSIWHVVFVNEESSSARVARIECNSQEKNREQE